MARVPSGLQRSAVFYEEKQPGSLDGRVLTRRKKKKRGCLDVPQLLVRCQALFEHATIVFEHPLDEQ
jgi:hypothetical protein